MQFSSATPGMSAIIGKGPEQHLLVLGGHNMQKSSSWLIAGLSARLSSTLQAPKVKSRICHYLRFPIASAASSALPSLCIISPCQLDLCLPSCLAGGGEGGGGVQG